MQAVQSEIAAMEENGHLQVASQELFAEVMM
jgi:hypothetical protein